MRICGVLLAFLVCGCASTQYTPSKVNFETCQKMVGKQSGLFTPSQKLKSELLGSIIEPQKYAGILWYIEDESTFYACAYTKDKNGCGTNTYRITSENDRRKSELLFSLEKICVLS